jgi:C4-dicarboxylate-specific signal transduction histidine kinase
MMLQEAPRDMSDLRFFGKMSAYISHEIKNVLAIIGESAGLVEDLLLLEERGMELNRERLKAITARIRAQTQRADEIVRNMNRVAHSVDEAVKAVDVAEVVRPIALIAQRLASMRGVVLDANTGEERVTVVTSPFYLEHLLWLCLDFATSFTDEEKVVRARLEAIPGGARLSFGGLKDLSALPVDGFPDARGQDLMRYLGASLQVDSSSLNLMLPERLPSISDELS